MGKEVKTPPMPDYKAAAKEQGEQNIEAARVSSRLSNPNMVTPFGNQTITYGTSKFDEAGYNKALQDYQNKAGSFATPDRAAFTKEAPVTSQWVNNGDSGYYQDVGGTTFDQQAYDEALSKVGKTPTKEMFTTIENPDTATITQTLTPEAQANLEAQQRVQRALSGLGEIGVKNASEILSTPFKPTSEQINKEFADYGRAQGSIADYGRAQGTIADYGRAMGEVPLTTEIDTSNFSRMPLNAGTTAQDLILQRLDPTIQAGDRSFAQTLANQGLAPGTEAYNTAFRNREMSKNDLYSQAALQGINLDMSARNQQLNEALGIGGFENQAQLSRAGLYNQALGQDYSTEFNRANLYNQALNQDYTTEFNRAGLYNSALGQDFSQGLQRAQFGNQAQQQQLAQDLTLRSQPLNEITALMSGSQIQLPQFTGYTPSQVAPAPTFAATQAGYQGQLAAANAQNAANSQLTQGLFSLGGAALLAPTGTFGKLFG
jgi:hypothetical protein